MENSDYMKLAIDLAREGEGKTSPNPMVGALIVRKNKIIGRGWHHHFGGPHAEILALRSLRGRARHSQLVVTLEPCHHFGKTPPCVDAVIASGIKEVVVGMCDPNPLTNGKSIRKMRKAGIKVKVGFCQEELARLNESYLLNVKQKRTFVTAKIAQTLDGKTATAKGHSKWITSAKTRQFTHRERNKYDAILVGINTVLSDDPFLNADKKKIKKVILDSRLRISPKAKLFRRTKPEDCFIATTKKAPERKRKIFEKKGVNVLVCPTKKGRIDLPWVLRQLFRFQVGTLLIEGGAKTIGEALKMKVVDKMQILTACKIFGDQKALSAVEGLKTVTPQQALKIDISKIKQLNDDILLEGYVVK